MESFGAILKETRELKEITVETVVRETTISRQYIEALETENLEIFPGHTYITGFLRNYSEYLGLEPSYMLKLLNGKVIQESPVPENLFKYRKINLWVLILIIVGSILFIGGVSTFIYLKWFYQSEDQAKTAVTLETEGTQRYTLSMNPIQKRIYQGDVLEVPLVSGMLTATVQDTVGALALSTDIGIQYVELGEELEIDLDGKDGTDIVVFLSDISKNDKKRGAEVRLMIKAGITSSMGEWKEEEIISQEELNATVNGKQTVLFSGNRAYPFTMNASFRGACLFRNQIDRKEEVEDFFTNGDMLTMKANNAIRIWMSNANTVKLQVIGDGKTADIEVGRAGQVLVQDIRWVKEVDGTFKLVVIDVE